MKGRWEEGAGETLFIPVDTGRASSRPPARLQLSYHLGSVSGVPKKGQSMSTHTHTPSGVNRSGHYVPRTPPSPVNCYL